MTFKPERYPTNWPAIRADRRARAEEQCECGDVRAVGRLPGLDGGDRG